MHSTHLDSLLSSSPDTSSLGGAEPDTLFSPPGQNLYGFRLSRRYYLPFLLDLDSFSWNFFAVQVRGGMFFAVDWIVR